MIDMKIKQAKTNSKSKDLLINNEVSRQLFPFEAEYTQQIIDENFLILYIMDKQYVISNKGYAFFERLFMAEDNNFRTKDGDIFDL